MSAARWTCCVSGCGRPVPWTDWTVCEGHLLQRAVAVQDAATSVAPVSDGTGCDHPFALAPGSRASTDSNDSARAGEPSSLRVDAPSERFARESWETIERMAQVGEPGEARP